MTPDDQDRYRARQRGNARVLALILGAFVILVFAISIVRIKSGAGM